MERIVGLSQNGVIEGVGSTRRDHNKLIFISIAGIISLLIIVTIFAIYNSSNSDVSLNENSNLFDEDYYLIEDENEIILDLNVSNKDNTEVFNDVSNTDVSNKDNTDVFNSASNTDVFNSASNIDVFNSASNIDVFNSGGLEQ